jgi:hypothetical protein
MSIKTITIKEPSHVRVVYQNKHDTNVQSIDLENFQGRLVPDELPEVIEKGSHAKYVFVNGEAFELSKNYFYRDVEQIPGAYGNHVHAMTTEKLDRKTDIAAELAVRDVYIEKLEDMLTQATSALSMYAQADYNSDVESKNHIVNDRGERAREFMLNLAEFNDSDNSYVVVHPKGR